MATSMNIVVIAGNLTRDPDLRYTRKGTAVAEFSVAINENYAKDGEIKESVVFVGVVAWEKNAEFAKERLVKGQGVLIQGRLIRDEWEDEKGNKKTKTKVQAIRIQFTGAKKEAT